MEDIIVSVPKSDASFRQVFERAQQESSVDHEWTLDEINAEIKAAREERGQVRLQHTFRKTENKSG